VEQVPHLLHGAFDSAQISQVMAIDMHEEAVQYRLLPPFQILCHSNFLRKSKYFKFNKNYKDL